MKKAEIAFKMRVFRGVKRMRIPDMAAYLGCRVEQIYRWESQRNYPRKKWLQIMQERGIFDIGNVKVEKL